MTHRGLWVVGCGLWAATLLIAQPVVAPTPAAVGAPRGEDAGGYNIFNSFEVGYRFFNVDGDSDKYRSDVNFGNGVRLLGSSLRIHSRTGQGRFLDELTILTQGLGNDPYQFSSLHVERNRLYRYDFTWRSQDYYNPALPLARGRHFMNTERQLQDHDFTLFPQSSMRLFLGYSRNAQTGPALTTLRDFDLGADAFPLFSDIRRLENEYRLGGELGLAGWRLTFLHGWSNFSENTTAAAPSVTRTEPYRGSSPYWRLNLRKQSRLWSADARYSYAGARRRAFFDELLTGSDRFGSPLSRQTLVAGTGRRPMSTGSLTLSLFPRDTVTVTNQTSFYNTRMDGDNVFQQLDNATLALDLINFQSLGIRTIANTTDASWRAARWLGFYGGYQFSTRRLRSIEQQRFGSTVDAVRAEQENTLHAGTAGLRLQPLQALSINLDAEAGRADRPFFPVSDKNYHLLGARIRYRLRTLTLAAGARSNYNTNSASLAEHSSRSRSYTADASWAPRGWFAFDASYSRLHLDTLTGIAYFAAENFVTGDRSYYVSDLHTGTATARFGLGRADLSVGYTRVQDRGGNTRPVASLPVFLAAQSFPLTYQSPLARLSIRLHEKLRLNAGYQFYDYAEDRVPLIDLGRQNYRAHTGYTSVMWSF